MSADIGNTSRWLWRLAFIVLAIYVAARMGAFALATEIETPGGLTTVANTFASVDHPFHVARADLLWRSLGAGQIPRWIAQHQGGYPVEFYPLGEAWLEVGVRALSLGTLTAQGAHTISVVVIFLLPGMAFLALAREDGWSFAPAFLALAFHVSLPGGWYSGGYTELVQWGLVTNVAGATASILMFPLLLRFLRYGGHVPAILAAALAAGAIYCNPRSLVGLVALGCGAWLASVSSAHATTPLVAVKRLTRIAGLAALLAAPELISLVRFGHLYQFVQYSSYATPADYVTSTLGAVGPAVLAVALLGLVYAHFARTRWATRATALSLLIYIAMTAAVAFVPAAAHLAPQLEPTRLMPLQRLMTIYLAAAVIWSLLDWLGARFAPRLPWIPSAAAALAAVAILAVQTRPLAGPAPDPASSEIPAVSLYPVAMSGQAVQVDLESAVREADRTAAPGTAILILGSELSWHQPLWAPLWTTRPLFYDNWLWYWHPYHAGTPGYQPVAGNHYPDPEQTLDQDYLRRHGIGAVVATGRVKTFAASSPLLQRVREGTYDAFIVREPVTTVTFGDENAAETSFRDGAINASAPAANAPVVVRENWFPRWSATTDGRALDLERRADGYLRAEDGSPLTTISLAYRVDALDWVGRALAAAGLVALGWLAIKRRRQVSPG